MNLSEVINKIKKRMDQKSSLVTQNISSIEKDIKSFSGEKSKLVQQLVDAELEANYELQRKIKEKIASVNSELQELQDKLNAYQNSDCCQLTNEEAEEVRKAFEDETAERNNKRNNISKRMKALKNQIEVLNGELKELEYQDNSLAIEREMVTLNSLLPYISKKAMNLYVTTQKDFLRCWLRNADTSHLFPIETPKKERERINVCTQEIHHGPLPDYQKLDRSRREAIARYDDGRG